MNMNRLLILFWVVMAVSSCAPRLMFSEIERQKLEKNAVAVTEVQFYNDKEIVLRRRKPNSDVQVTSGVIKTIDGTAVWEIRIPRYTECIADTFIANERKIGIRFERGDDRLLWFKENSYGMFQLDAEAWKNGRGKIQYAGQEFRIEVLGNDALLVVRKTKEYKDATRSDRVDGLKIGDTKHRRGRRNVEPTRSVPTEDEPSDEGGEDESEEDGSSEENPDGGY